MPPARTNAVIHPDRLLGLIRTARAGKASLENGEVAPAYSALDSLADTLEVVALVNDVPIPEEDDNE